MIILIDLSRACARAHARYQDFILKIGFRLSERARNCPRCDGERFKRDHSTKIIFPYPPLPLPFRKYEI